MNPTLWDKLGTAIFVTVIAMMVWLYAEGRTVSEATRQISVRFVAPSGQELMIARLDNNNEIQRIDTLDLEVTLDAAQSALSRLDNSLTKAIPLEVTANEASPDQLVDIKQAISRDLLTAMGITIKNASIEQVRLHIEPIDTVADVPINIVGEDGGPLGSLLETLDGPPTVAPDKATVKLPRSLAQTIGGEAVQARLKAQDIQGAIRGVRTQSVALSLPQSMLETWSPWISIKPTAVDVSFTVNETSGLWESDNPIPIKIMAPPSVYEKYDIGFADGQPPTVSFSVSGPASAIEELEAFPPLAFVEITSGKVNAALSGVADNSLPTLQATLRFVLPHGLRSGKVATEPQGLVRLVIKPRATTEQPAP